MSKFFHLIEGGLPFLKTYSIKKKIKTSYVIIIACMLFPTITSVATSIFQSIRYDQIITNVNKTNRLNQIVKTDVSDEIWDIFAGKKKFSEGIQYEIIDDINYRLDDILQTTDVTENRQMLEVAGRAVKTLTNYVDRMGMQMKNNYAVIENEKILEEVRGVSVLVSDILQDFIVLEIESAASTNERIKKTTWILVFFQTLIVLFVTGFAIFAQRSVSSSINKPIKELEIMSQLIAEGNLLVSVDLPHVKELDKLTENLNIMAVKIKELIEANILEQKNLQKSEMKALQAQITPHFLYNTLDTIVWLAEAHQYDQVINITHAFSTFFRTSLSRGRDWITVEEEFNHIKSYLTIQKIRYRDILDYSIEYDPSMAGNAIVKLLLQPIVENALYHGIKNKRGKGSLAIRGWMEEDKMCFSVVDDGIGMTSERLENVVKQIEGCLDPDTQFDIYGLYNVNKRLSLYYNNTVRLEIESVYKEGTKVAFRVPVVNLHV